MSDLGTLNEGLTNELIELKDKCEMLRGENKRLIIENKELLREKGELARQNWQLRDKRDG